MVMNCSVNPESNPNRSRNFEILSMESISYWMRNIISNNVVIAKMPLATKTIPVTIAGNPLIGASNTGRPPPSPPVRKPILRDLSLNIFNPLTNSISPDNNIQLTFSRSDIDLTSIQRTGRMSGAGELLKSAGAEIAQGGMPTLTLTRLYHTSMHPRMPCVPLPVK